MAPLLDKLEAKAEFWISASLRVAVLQDAGEASAARSETGRDAP